MAYQQLTILFEIEKKIEKNNKKYEKDFYVAGGGRNDLNGNGR